MASSASAISAGGGGVLSHANANAAAAIAPPSHVRPSIACSFVSIGEQVACQPQPVSRSRAHWSRTDHGRFYIQCVCRVQPDLANHPPNSNANTYQRSPYSPLVAEFTRYSAIAIAGRCANQLLPFGRY